MSKRNGNRKLPKASPPWKSWLLALAAMVGLLVTELQTQAIAEQDNPEKGITEVMDINLQTICPSMPGLPKDLKDVKGFKHAAHAKEYLKRNASFSAVELDGNFTCSACHPKAGSQEEISGKPVCDRLSGTLTAVGGPENMKKYYHETCLGCHRDMHKAEKATGPVKCKGCHTKQVAVHGLKKEVLQ